MQFVLCEENGMWLGHASDTSKTYYKTNILQLMQSLFFRMCMRKCLDITTTPNTYFPPPAILQFEVSHAVNRKKNLCAYSLTCKKHLPSHRNFDRPSQAQPYFFDMIFCNFFCLFILLHLYIYFLLPLILHSGLCQGRPGALSYDFLLSTKLRP